MRIIVAIAAAPLLFTALPARAQDPAVASAAIAAGDYASAENALASELRIHPNRPELLLNLAAVYANTGRTSEARALYRKVLDQREVLMDLTPEKTASSYAVAYTGLKRISALQVTSR